MKIKRLLAGILAATMLLGSGSSVMADDEFSASNSVQSAENLVKEENTSQNDAQNGVSLQLSLHNAIPDTMYTDDLNGRKDTVIPDNKTITITPEEGYDRDEIQNQINRGVLDDKKLVVLAIVRDYQNSSSDGKVSGSKVHKIKVSSGGKIGYQYYPNDDWHTATDQSDLSLIVVPEYKMVLADPNGAEQTLDTGKFFTATWNDDRNSEVTGRSYIKYRFKGVVSDLTYSYDSFNWNRDHAYRTFKPTERDTHVNANEVTLDNFDIEYTFSEYSYKYENSKLPEEPQIDGMLDNVSGTGNDDPDIQNKGWHVYPKYGDMGWAWEAAKIDARTIYLDDRRDSSLPYVRNNISVSVKPRIVYWHVPHSVQKNEEPLYNDDSKIAGRAQGTVIASKTAKWVNKEKGIGEVTVSVGGTPIYAGSDVVIVLDISESMSKRYSEDGNQNPGGAEREYDAKLAAWNTAEKLLADPKSNNRVAICSFEAWAGPSVWLQNSKGIGYLKSYLKQLSMIGLNTNYAAGLNEAYKILAARNQNEKNRPSYVLFISDGAPDDVVWRNLSPNDRSIDGNRDRLINEEKSIIHSIGISVDADKEKYLREVANHNNNNFHSIKNANELESLLNTLAGQILTAGVKAKITDVVSKYFNALTDSDLSKLAGQGVVSPEIQNSPGVTINGKNVSIDIGNIPVVDEANDVRKFSFYIEVADQSAWEATRTPAVKTNDNVYLDYNEAKTNAGKRIPKEKIGEPQLSLKSNLMVLNYYRVNSDGEYVDENGENLPDNLKQAALLNTITTEAFNSQVGTERTYKVFADGSGNEQTAKIDYTNNEVYGSIPEGYEAYEYQDEKNVSLNTEADEPAVVDFKVVSNTASSTSLRVKKIIKGDDTKASKPANNKYPVKITLNAPANQKLPESLKVIEGTTEKQVSGNVVNIEVPVDDTGVVLSGIPKGTTYTVEEDLSKYPDFSVSYDKEKGTLDGNTTVTITNTVIEKDDPTPTETPTPTPTAIPRPSGHSSSTSRTTNPSTPQLNTYDHYAYVIGYPDKSVHPSGEITRAETAAIFFRLLTPSVRDSEFAKIKRANQAAVYDDVKKGSWYYSSVAVMKDLGIIYGYPDGSFKPNAPITRAEFAAIAERFNKNPSGEEITYNDIAGHWAEKDIKHAAADGWIYGYPDGTFKPNNKITRAEAMAIVNRVLKRYPDAAYVFGLQNDPDLHVWTDNGDRTRWYYLDVQEATNSHTYHRTGKARTTNERKYGYNTEWWDDVTKVPNWDRYNIK